MRLIDADELIPKMQVIKVAEHQIYGYGANGWGFVARCMEAVESVPTIEAEPVRHGHWIWDDNGMDWYIGSWKCSICRCKNDNLGNRKNIVPSRFAGSKYCPHCGAKMDEVSE